MSVCHHFLSFRQRHLLSRNQMITRGSTLAPKQLNFFLTRNGARKQSFKVCIWAATQRFSQNTIHNGISTRARNYERSESQPQTLGRHDSSRETERRRVGSWQEKRLDKRRSYWQKKWLDTSYWYPGFTDERYRNWPKGRNVPRNLSSRIQL
jgi:hypothetical protein